MLRTKTKAMNMSVVTPVCIDLSRPIAVVVRFHIGVGMPFGVFATLTIMYDSQ